MAAELYCGDRGGRDGVEGGDETVGDGDVSEETCIEEGYYPWYAGMRRSAFVDDYLFAISNLGVTASHVDDPADVLAEIPFLY
jgi:hypothetical protein